jgi:hypothetical protein
LGVWRKLTATKIRTGFFKAYVLIVVLSKLVNGLEIVQGPIVKHPVFTCNFKKG